MIIIKFVYSRLVSEEECKAIISEIETTLRIRKRVNGAKRFPLMFIHRETGIRETVSRAERLQ